MTAMSVESGRRFDLGRVVRMTFGVITRNLSGFVTIALLLVGAPSLVIGLVQLGMTQRDGGLGATGLPNYDAPMILVALAGFIISMSAWALMQATIMKATVADLNGAKVTPMASLGMAAQFILPVIGLTIVMFLGFLLGWMLLLVPGMIVGVMWSVALPALVTERRGIFASLQRSRDLTRKHRWPIFGIFVVYFIAYFALFLAIAAIGGSAAGITGYSLINVVASTVVGVVSSIVASVGVAALYIELRSVKDGVGPEELASVFD